MILRSAASFPEEPRASLSSDAGFPEGETANRR